MAEELIDLNDAMDSVTASVMEGYKPAVKPAAKPAPTAEEEESKGEETAGEESEEQEEEEQEEEVQFASIETITDALVTEFAIRDKNGDEVEPPALIIEFKANGKMRSERLDQVVKLAQFGVYNVERAEQAAARQTEIEGIANGAIERLETRESQLRYLLENEGEYDKARERYLQENSPEKRVARAEGEVSTLREQQQQAKFVEQASEFYEGTVLPAIDSLAAEFPEVALDEISAQFSAALVPVMRNGVVPPSAYGNVEDYIQTTLRAWAEAKHTARSERLSGVTKKADDKTAAAQVSAAKAKRVVAEATRPAVRSGIGGTGKAKASSGFATLEDAEDDALSTALASMKS